MLITPMSQRAVPASPGKDLPQDGPCTFSEVIGSFWVPVDPPRRPEKSSVLESENTPPQKTSDILEWGPIPSAGSKQASLNPEPEAKEFRLTSVHTVKARPVNKEEKALAPTPETGEQHIHLRSAVPPDAIHPAQKAWPAAWRPILDQPKKVHADFEVPSAQPMPASIREQNVVFGEGGALHPSSILNTGSVLSLETDGNSQDGTPSLWSWPHPKKSHATDSNEQPTSPRRGDSSFHSTASPWGSTSQSEFATPAILPETNFPSKTATRMLGEACHSGAISLIRPAPSTDSGADAQQLKLLPGFVMADPPASAPHPNSRPQSVPKAGPTSVSPELWHPGPAKRVGVVASSLTDRTAQTASDGVISTAQMDEVSDDRHAQIPRLPTAGLLTLPQLPIQMPWGLHLNLTPQEAPLTRTLLSADGREGGGPEPDAQAAAEAALASTKTPATIRPSSSFSVPFPRGGKGSTASESPVPQPEANRADQRHPLGTRTSTSGLVQDLAAIGLVGRETATSALLPPTANTAQVGGGISPLPHAQISHLIIQLARNGERGQTDLMLRPEGLGHLCFDISTKGDRISIVLFVEKADAMDLIRRHSDQFLNELRLSGFSQTSLSFGEWSQRHNRSPPPRPAKETLMLQYFTTVLRRLMRQHYRQHPLGVWT